MVISLKDGARKQFEDPKSVYEMILDINEGLARKACAAEINGEIVDLRTVIYEDCQINIVTSLDEKGLRVLRQTTAHVLAEAVKEFRPHVKMAIGPATDTGFYYDFECEPFSSEELEEIEKIMKKIIRKRNKLGRLVLTKSEALEFMKEKKEPYKLELIERLSEEDAITFYEQGEFVDLCAGPHVMNTRMIKAFKLLSSSGAYWRGDENKNMLTRIYGTSYFDKKDLADHIEKLEDAKKRDHNKLGRELGLFTTVDVIGQGLPLLLPKGAKIIQTLQRWIEDEEDINRGYDKDPIDGQK